MKLLRDYVQIRIDYIPTGKSFALLVYRLLQRHVFPNNGATPTHGFTPPKTLQDAAAFASAHEIPFAKTKS
jgi:hypothetical protein